MELINLKHTLYLLNIGNVVPIDPCLLNVNIFYLSVLGFLLDMTTEFYRGLAPFMPLYFRDFVRCLLPFFPILESMNSPGPDLRSTFLSQLMTVIKSWFWTTWVISYPDTFLPDFWISEVSIPTPCVLSQWTTKITSALSSSSILLLTFIEGFFLRAV